MPKGKPNQLRGWEFLTQEGLHAYQLDFWWGTPTDLGNILAFLAWVYQAIERHAEHMTFHPSIDLSLASI